MSFLYWLSKFSHEAMLIELLLIGCIAASYFAYLLLQKRRFGAAKKQIPDHVVRAFLSELISYCEGFKNQLFGEEFKVLINQAQRLAIDAGAAPQAAGNVDAAELNTIRAALGASSAKQAELQNAINLMAKEKAALEAKLAAGGGGAGAGDGNLAELNEKIARLESKLAEYEVIEDDLANLKKYQQENKSLRAQLEALQKGGATQAAVAPAAPAPTPEPVATAAPAAAAEPTPVEEAPVEAVAPPPAPTAEAEPEQPAATAAESPLAAAEETADAAKAADSFESLVDKVEESLAPPAGASAVDPMAAAAVQTSAPVSDKPEPKAQATPPPAPAAAAAPASAPPKEKTDADLLNEFERMLSS